MRFSIEYDQIPLDLFRELPPETYSVEFFRACEHSNGYVDASAAATLRALGVWPGREPRLLQELVEAAAVRPERVEEFRWLFEKLRRAGCLAADRSGRLREAGPPPAPPAELRAAILAEDPAAAPTLDLIDAAAEGYPAFLRGERDGAAVLFSPRTLHLWERYFSNQNRVYAASNLLGAHAAARALPARPARVLEVGGGLGSGAEALLDAILGARRGSTAAEPIGAYRFTEISPGFLRRGQDRLLDRFPGIPFEFGQLDLNRPLAAQGIPEGSFDLVYAVNTLHAARDLLASLRELWGAIAPGGLLAVVEALRPAPEEPLYIEYVFQLLREFRECRVDPECRPHGGFLAWPHWRRALERAGFEEVRAVPDFETAVRAYPGYAMAAMLARRPLRAGGGGGIAASAPAPGRGRAALAGYLDCLPQKPPFLFVDELLELRPLAGAVGAVSFPAGHPLFENHLPGNPLVPGVILIEALAQLSGLVLIPGDEPRPILGYLGEVRRMRFRRRVLPGERVELRSRLLQRFAGAARFEVEARAGGDCACEGEIIVGGGTTSPPSGAISIQES